MSTDVLEKVAQLPPEMQKQVEAFIESLLLEHKQSDLQESELLAEKRRKNMGWAKGQIWMADDFNDTPEDFKEYI